MSDPLSRRAVPHGELTPSSMLRVYETGELTVVGFGGQDVPTEVCIAEYRDQLNRLIEQHDCRTLAVDLSGVKLMPSGLLGMLVSLRKRLESIELFNPSNDILDVLEITRLRDQFVIRELEL